MKICILGCSGFIGSHLISRLLLDSKYEITGIDLSDYKIQDNIERFNFIKGDIYSLDIEKYIQQSDIVIFLASICNPSQYITDPVETIRSNFTKPSQIVDLCSKYKKRIIATSTCEVYGKTISSYVSEEYTDPSLYVQDELTTPMVLGSVRAQRWNYACAKQLLDRYIYALGDKEDLNYTIVRPYNFFGPMMDYIPGKDGVGLPRVVACFMEALLNNEPIKIVDGGKAYRTITYIDDAIDAYVKIIENKAASANQIFNIANPANEIQICTLAKEFCNSLARVTGNDKYKEHPIISISGEDFYGVGYEDCDRRAPSIENVVNKISWQPKTNLDDTLEKTVSFFWRFYCD